MAEKKDKSLEDRIDELEKENKLIKTRSKFITKIIAIICICLAISLIINASVITLILSALVVLLAIILFGL